MTLATCCRLSPTSSSHATVGFRLPSMLQPNTEGKPATTLVTCCRLRPTSSSQATVGFNVPSTLIPQILGNLLAKAWIPLIEYFSSFFKKAITFLFLVSMSLVSQHGFEVTSTILRGSFFLFLSNGPQNPILIFEAPYIRPCSTAGSPAWGNWARRLPPPTSCRNPTLGP